MKKKSQKPSIRYSMVKGIILFVLVPLFLALTILGFLLQHTTSRGIQEAFRMLFSQNVTGIDSAILQSNYASSTMITYTENNKFLKRYYEAQNRYEKNRATEQIEKMILNCQVSTMGSFEGEMMILTNDGRLISSIRAWDVSPEVPETVWYQEMKESGQVPYWNDAINDLFYYNDNKQYVAFGRALVKYQGQSMGYVLVRIPKQIFFQFNDNESFQGGTIAMFSPKGDVIVGNTHKVPEEDMKELFERWKKEGKRQGKYADYYIMSSSLDSSSNTVMYIGRIHDIFARSEQIIYYLILCVAAVTIFLVLAVLSVSGYITTPILALADRIQYIGQDDPELLMLEQNYFQETTALEDGMLLAQKRIRLLMEEVRRETEMKEKARFDALKAQINPHFLFNTLNAIRWKASINQDHEVADILSELGILLGETYKSDEEMETIQNTMQILDAYVKIMQIRFGNKVQFFFVIPDQIREYLIPRFCLQPLVENAFIHGMSHLEQGIIALRGELSGKDIVLTLIDNGAGIHGKILDLEAEEIPNKRGITGIGLSNIHKRIQALFGKQYGLKIDTEIAVGFKISLRIPAIKQEADDDESIDR
ncbi:MAG: histidine kinase [Lachnospiraceae bacterium]|nr:histidine kinase [Lachnospiraceae bacterium]